MSRAASIFWAAMIFLFFTSLFVSGYIQNQRSHELDKICAANGGSRILTNAGYICIKVEGIK